MLSFEDDADHPIARRFRAFVEVSGFPCVGAKAALARGTLQIKVARDIRSAWDDLTIYAGLLNLASSYTRDPKLFQSLAILFETPGDLTEEAFEAAMWDRVQSLSDKDAFHGQSYDMSVSDDPEDPHFSLSFGEQAFFVVGLHPHASRPARRFEHPALVFNLHDQFEQLRSMGTYEGMREKIISRDIAMAGSANPMLSRHGEGSEARQYSGRVVTSAWKCPFMPQRREMFDVDHNTASVGDGVHDQKRTATHRR